ncbi:MAG: hypothetical protein BWZ02_00606 [Lentisphaerae bacterium ADurb.BinA184]|nr:MAG: hypothetical protein BWZ02_00606 [Lentisphaerae bacterium ADurb.BinA184]
MGGAEIVDWTGKALPPSGLTLIAETCANWHRKRDLTRHDGFLNVAFLDRHVCQVAGRGPQYQMDAYGTQLTY